MPRSRPRFIKKPAALALLGMMLISALRAQSPAPDASKLTRMLNDFLAGASRNEIAAHELFWADDLIYTSSSGRRMGKAEILREVRAEAAKPSGPAATYSADQIRIQQYGTAAIVAFRLIGKTEKETKYYLDSGTFLKRNGEWRVVNWQATALPPNGQTMNQIAERYVRLVLALGQHDPDYVDAFYGPAEWKTEAAKEKKPLQAIGAEAGQLREQIKRGSPPPEEMERLRREYVGKQLSALEARVRIIGGERMSFDEESRVLYDATAPTFPDAHFDEVLKQLEAKIPGGRPALAALPGMAQAVHHFEGET